MNYTGIKSQFYIHSYSFDRRIRYSFDRLDIVLWNFTPKLREEIKIAGKMQSTKYFNNTNLYIIVKKYKFDERNYFFNG